MLACLDLLTKAGILFCFIKVVGALDNCKENTEQEGFCERGKRKERSREGYLDEIACWFRTWAWVCTAPWAKPCPMGNDQNQQSKKLFAFQQLWRL